MKMTDIYETAEYTLKALKNCGADAAQCIAAAESSVPDEAEQIAPFTAKAEYKTGVFEPDLDKLFDRIDNAYRHLIDLN